MREKIKTRIAYYCNLKAILIYLVIFGHLIEDMARTQPLLMGMYRVIYSIHMPLFAYLCGVCSKDEGVCLRQMKENFMCYAVIQTVVWLISMAIGADMDPLVSWWHSWFLLSMVCWRGLAIGWHVLRRYIPGLGYRMTRAGVVLGAVAVACAAGHWTAIGRVLSLSRTIVFLPYFLLGLLLPKDFNWRRYRELGEIALALALGGLYMLGDVLPTEFLYQAEGYAALGVAHGGLLRLACYTLGMMGGFALLTLVPGHRTRYTRYGVDTLPVYLAHAPLAFLLRQVRLAPVSFIALAPLAAAGVFYLLYRVFCDRRIGCRLVDLEGNALGEIVPLWMRWI